jgi:uncharacterized protein with NRDE domain
MCLILLSYKNSLSNLLVLAGNRDEFYDRPTSFANFWPDESNILAGRDLKWGGTWLGITKTGRIAALTNYRDPANDKDNAPTRGQIVSNYLCDHDEPIEYLYKLKMISSYYNGFSLFLGDLSQLYFFSNREGTIHKLMPGSYGISNNLLSKPWPKVKHGIWAFQDAISKTRSLSSETLFEVLSNRARYEDRELPNTGVGLQWERILSSIFIVNPAFGTRCSTVLLIDHNYNVTFIERSFDSNQNMINESKYTFKIIR